MAKKHIHKLKRINIGTKSVPYKVYKCILASCSSYFPMKLIEGKIVLCNRCNEPMVMTKLAMTLALPHCLDCTESTRKETIGIISEYLDDIGKE